MSSRRKPGPTLPSPKRSSGFAQAGRNFTCRSERKGIAGAASTVPRKLFLREPMGPGFRRDDNYGGAIPLPNRLVKVGRGAGRAVRHQRVIRNFADARPAAALIEAVTRAPRHRVENEQRLPFRAGAVLRRLEQRRAAAPIKPRASFRRPPKPQLSSRDLFPGPIGFCSCGYAGCGPVIPVVAGTGKCRDDNCGSGAASTGRSRPARRSPPPSARRRRLSRASSAP